MPELMSSIGDLSSLVSGALEKPVVSQPAPKPTPASVPSEPAALSSTKQVLEAGGFAPVTPQLQSQAVKELAKEKVESMQPTYIAPDKKQVTTAMGRLLNIFNMDIDDAKKEADKYNELLPNFDKKVLEARRLYEKKEAELGTEQAKVAMFKILGHLAMGIYGAQHGVDTSGIVFDTTDWAARHNKLLNEYKMDIDLAEGEYRRGESRMSRIENLMKWARAGGEQEAAETARARAASVEAENRKKMFEAEQLLKEEAAGTKLEQTALKQAAKEEELKRKEERQDIIAGQKAEQKLADKDRAEINQLSLALAKESKTGKKVELGSLLSKKLGGLTFEEWKASPEAEKGWLSTDSSDYLEYVKGLTSPSPAANIKAEEGPFGETTVRDGKTYRWNPSKKQYFLVK